MCIVFRLRLFQCLEGRRGRAASSVAVRFSVCEDELGAILLIQTDSLMLRAQIIPATSPHVGGGAVGTVRRPGLHTPNEPIRSCRGEGGDLMWRDVAKFIEEPGGDGERGVIDWPFAHLHLRDPTVTMRDGTECPGDTFIC